MKEDFDQSERWVHSPSNMWDDWQMRRPIIKKRLQIDSKTKSPLGLTFLLPPSDFLKEDSTHGTYNKGKRVVVDVES